MNRTVLSGVDKISRVAEIMLELKDLETRRGELRAEVVDLIGETQAGHLFTSIAPRPTPVPVGVSMAPVHGAAPRTSQAPATRTRTTPTSVSSRVVALAASAPERAWTYHAFRDALGTPFDRATLYSLVAAGRLKRGGIAGEFFGVEGAK